MALDPTIPHGDLTYTIIGAAMRVHNNLGPGYKERFYQQALTNELRSQNLAAEEELPFELYLRDQHIGCIFLDHLVERQVIVEVKSFPHMLTDEEVAQVICYLAATDRKVGLLLNFGRKRLQYKRILQPKDVVAWPDRIQRYLWKPKS